MHWAPSDSGKACVHERDATGLENPFSDLCLFLFFHLCQHRLDKLCFLSLLGSYK